MFARYSIFAFAVLATLVCGNAQAALIEAALTPKPDGDWMLVVIDLATYRVGLDFDRSAFWLSIPTVNIEGLSALQNGVALHDFAPELALGVDTVTITPDVDTGHWWYITAVGSRQVFLTVPTPEPSSAVLVLFGAIAFWRRHSTASGS